MDENTIIFPNGNRARMVTPPAGTAASDIIKALDIPPPGPCYYFSVAPLVNNDTAVFNSMQQDYGHMDFLINLLSLTAWSQA